MNRNILTQKEMEKEMKRDASMTLESVDSGNKIREFLVLALFAKSSSSAINAPLYR